MYLVSLVCALTLLLFLIGNLIIRKDKTIIINGIKRIPYSLFPFVISMFFLVLALENQGVTYHLKDLLIKTNTTFSYGLASFLSCSLINNIPMSVLFSSITADTSSIYASIIGSNIGAFLTPIGALAGIMWLSILKKNDIKFSFLDFVKYGAIISIPTIFISLLGLFIII
jgi:arsenical pump membrane protein